MKNIKLGTTAALALALMASGVATFTAKAAEDKSYKSDSDVNFVPSEDTEGPTDPTDPGKPVDPEPGRPGTSGPLSIDFASDFNFGEQEIQTGERNYYAKPQTYKGTTPPSMNYVQITDKRGTNAGWTLQVKQDKQFTSEEDVVNKTIKGAVISIVKGDPVSVSESTAPDTYAVELDAENGAYSKVMDATKSAGAGTWISKFGEVEEVEVKPADGTNAAVKEDRNTGVKLHIPTGSVTDKTTYKTSLTWNLTDVPNNG